MNSYEIIRRLHAYQKGLSYSFLLIHSLLPNVDRPLQVSSLIYSDSEP